ncbi:MAG: biopolymer transporter ExbD [Alphaproteobacteria bacterium]|nr:biopolymer transporter ExbD [Alphaproteobacteria bacterium]
MALRNLAALPLFPANKAKRRRSPISLTPLIDVVFILLIFFMLASNVTDWRAISLNAPGEGAASAAIEGALLVEVRPKEIRLSGKPITLINLSATIAAAVRKKPTQRVMVKTATGVILQRAIVVLDALSAAGARNLSLHQ